MPTGETRINLAELRDALTWLTQAKKDVDDLIARLKTVPDAFDGAVTNPDADEPEVNPQLMATAAAPIRNTAGQKGPPGPTFFGTLPNGVTMANRNVETYNSMLAGLVSVAKDLARSIEGTNYILTRYKDNEEAMAADITRFMTNPPYQPGA